MGLRRIASIALFAGLAGQAMWLAAADRDQAYVLSVVERLERGESVTPLQIETAAGVASADPARHMCRSDLLRPGLFVKLRHLGQVEQGADKGKLALVRADTRDYLTAMIRCLPSNGNAWLRDAFVTYGVGGDLDLMRQKASMAMQLTPFEEQQVLARLFLWKQMSPSTLSACANLVRSDIRSILLYGTERLKEELAKPARLEGFTELLKEERARIPSGIVPAPAS